MSLSPLRSYLASLPAGKVVLWCYFIWYLVTVSNYFDPSPAIWLNSMGISAVIGFALHLSVRSLGTKSSASWQNFRFFLIPFCVSSFSSLIKGRGFILIAPPSTAELAVSLGSCATFVLLVLALKRLDPEGRT